MQHWSVTVTRDGEHVVTIESNSLAGRELDAEDKAAIRTAADCLLGFVGPEDGDAAFEIPE